MFLLQLDDLPPSWEDIEATALRGLVPGPGNCCVLRDLHHLDHFGMPAKFLDLRSAAPAIKFRVACCENVCNGGLQVRRRARELRSALQRSGQLYRIGRWADWLRRAFYQQLDDSLALFEDRGMTFHALEETLAPGIPRPYPKAVALNIRRRFQRAARDALDVVPTD